MFEQIVDQLPELKKLEQSISSLEQELARAQGRVQGLANRTAEVREADLNNAALSLNRGHKPLPPKEPAVREQLEEATRELEILDRRLALAQADRSKFIQSNHERLAELLAQARSAEGEKVAAGARQVLDDLLRLYKAEDDARALRRLVPEPANENTGAPERATAVWGPLTVANSPGGPRRGDLESALRHLQSLGPATVVGEDSEAGAA